ncbi:unnamed protein product [Ophioblennius macclurei]
MKMLIGLCGLMLALISICSAQPLEHPVVASPHATDCTHLKNRNPELHSGVYLIHPAASKVPFKVYCKVRKDGGWTVIQRRTSAALSFSKNWTAYEYGFGRLIWDHWLGLRKIHLLTQSNRTTLRVDLWDHKGKTAYAKYKNFNLGNRHAGYRLHAMTYKGTAGDAILGSYPGMDQRFSGFSTFDRDNDHCNPCIYGNAVVHKCAGTEGEGGWWFSTCGSANLNGKYHENGFHLGWNSGLHWRTWRYDESLKATRMMIKSE